MKFDDFFLNG